MAGRIFSKNDVTPELKLSALLRNTVQQGECLVWTRSLNTDGYPTMFHNVKVHRLVAELAGKEIEGLVVRHSCDNPKCINPSHLTPGTATENMVDRDSRGRHGAAKLKHHDVITIRELLATERYKQKEIADMFGIDARTVSSINCGSHWVHV